MEIKNKSWAVMCPHCSNEFYIKIHLEANDGIFSNTDTLPREQRPREEKFSSYEVLLLKRCEENGILQAFIKATETAKGSTTPKDLDRYFLGWLRTAQRVVIPQESLNVLIAAFPNTVISVLGTQGIVLVLTNRQPRMFVPDAYTRTPAHQMKKADALKIALPVSQTELIEWIRTKNGYVSGRGLFWDELRGKAAGAFANPAL